MNQLSFSRRASARACSLIVRRTSIKLSHVYGSVLGALHCLCHASNTSEKLSRGSSHLNVCSCEYFSLRCVPTLFHLVGMWSATSLSRSHRSGGLLRVVSDEDSRSRETLDEIDDVGH